MPDRMLGDNTKPEQKEDRDKLDRIAKLVENLVAMELGEEFRNHTYLLQLRNQTTGVSVYVGAGCPVCSIARGFHWLIENLIPHDEADHDWVPMPMIAIPYEKTPRKDVN